MRALAKTSSFVVALAILLLILAAGTVWHLAFRWGRSLPSEMSLIALADPAQIHWGETGTIAIEARQLNDAVTALGFAHATQHAWTMALWRQAALGKLSIWFGEDVFEVDRLTRQLGFAELAKMAADSLSSPTFAFLEAYTAGVNAAWPNIQRQHELLLIDDSPVPWQPWHTLAIERLLAWLSEPPSAACHVAPSVCKNDDLLRNWLRVYGFEHSVAWLTDVTGQPVLFQRHVLGTSALPVLQETALQISGQVQLLGASIIGTPFFPAAKRGSTSWAIMLSSPRTLAQGPSVTPVYERIVLAHGEERLITFARQDGHLVLDTSNVALEWSGLRAVSDASAWHALLRGDSALFQLLRGDGLFINDQNTWSIGGTPSVLQALPGGVLIGNAPEAAYVAAYFNTRANQLSDAQLWKIDSYSTWAADTLPQMLASIGEEPASPSLRNALTYLRNWDFDFHGHSVGAAIFSEWIRTNVPASESASGLPEAVLRLTQRFGEDQSQWRWEHMYTDRRYFAVGLWKQVAQFAPLEWNGTGHSTSPVWGGTLINGTPVPPAIWEMWVDIRPAGPVHVRKRHIDPYRPLGRYIAEQAEPITLQLSSFSQQTTALLP